MQHIDVHSEFNNCRITLLGANKLLSLAGASRACVDFCDPTAITGLRFLAAYVKQMHAPLTQMVNT